MLECWVNPPNIYSIIMNELLVFCLFIDQELSTFYYQLICLRYFYRLCHKLRSKVCH